MIYPIYPINNKKELIASLTQCAEDNGFLFECESKRLDGKCLWSLWTTYGSDKKRHFSFIKLHLLYKDNDVYTYDELSYETEFDSFTGCPLSYLDSANDSPYIDQEWRNLVRAKMEARQPENWGQCKRLFHRLSVKDTGQRIRLDLEGLRSKRAGKSEDIPWVILESLNPLRGRYKGRLYEIKRCCIVGFELVPPPRHPKGLMPTKTQQEKQL